MTTGRISRVDHNAGFAFVMRDDGGDDAFVHYNDLYSAGVVYPRVGLSLSFSLLDKDGKPRAFNVRAID